MPRGRPRKTEVPEAAPAPPPIDYETVREFYHKRAVDDCYVTVLRYTEAGSLEFICQGSPSAVDEAYVQERFGGGKFCFRLKNPEGSYLAQSTVSIAAPPESFTPEAPPPPEADPWRAQLDLMRDQLARQQEMVLHLIDKNGAAAPQNDLVKVIEAVAALRSFADPGAHVKGVVSALTEGMRLGMKQTNGGNTGGERETKVESALRVVEKISEMVPRVFPRLAQAPPDPAANPAGAHVGPQAADPRAVLQGTINYLKTKISKDPALWAEMILDNLEEGHWRVVAEALIDKPYDEIAEMIGDPDLKREPYRAWFTKLLAELKLAYQANLDTGGTPRNRGDATENE